MTQGAIEALRADHRALADTAGGFSADDWATPSGCEGWAVRDVVAHMTQLFRLLVDPSTLPAPDPSGSTERTQDRFVEAVRDVEPNQILADYRMLGEQAIDRLAERQSSDKPTNLGDLGIHPRHMVANAYSFDHYTHIRVDLLAPLGPLPHHAPPSDELRLTPAIDWMVAGLPQMQAAALGWLDAPVTLELTGPGGRTVHFGPANDGQVPIADGPGDGAVASVTSSTSDLVLWGTRRRAWRDLDVRLEGATDVATWFCDAVHVF